MLSNTQFSVIYPRSQENSDKYVNIFAVMKHDVNIRLTNTNSESHQLYVCSQKVESFRVNNDMGVIPQCKDLLTINQPSRKARPISLHVE